MKPLAVDTMVFMSALLSEPRANSPDDNVCSIRTLKVSMDVWVSFPRCHRRPDWWATILSGSFS